MTFGKRAAGDLSYLALAALNFAVYIVSIGFVVELPLLPVLMERALPDGTSDSLISLHTGLSTSVYGLCIYLFARFWARLSKRYNPCWIIIIGLTGIAGVMLAFSQAESLAARYAERFLSGTFAAAVLPIAAGVTASGSLDVKRRHRRLGFMSMVTSLGFVLGPLIGLAVISLTPEFYAVATPFDAFSLRMMSTAGLALLAATAVAFCVPDLTSIFKSKLALEKTDKHLPRSVQLLALTFIVGLSIGILEMGITLLGRMHLSLNSNGIAFLYAECALVMMITHGIVFSPWFELRSTRWLMPVALLVMTLSIVSIPWAKDHTFAFWGISSSAGILAPMLSHLYSVFGSREDRAQGKQSAFFSLGFAIGTGSGALISPIMFPIMYSILGLLVFSGLLLSLRISR